VSGIIRVRKDKENPFAQVPRALIEDTTLTWQARGVLTYLVSKPSDWQVQVTDLINQGDLGRAAIYGVLKELEAHGYITRRQNTLAGRFGATEYTVYEAPLHNASPRADSPYTAEPLTEKPYTADRTLSNKEVSTNKDSTNNESSRAKRASKTIDLPEDLSTVEGLPEAWGDWLAHRRELRCALTPHAATEQFKKLRASPDPVRLVRHSLGNGWRGLFEPKPDRPGITRLDVRPDIGARDNWTAEQWLGTGTETAEPGKDWL
jgi:hypothetical protein